MRGSPRNNVLSSRRGLREGDLRAPARRRRGLDDRAGRAVGRHCRIRLGHGAQARRARPRHARPVSRRAADRRGHAPRACGAAPPPAAGALPRRVARRPVGSRPRGGRGARARAVGGSRGADRGQARRPDARPARRPDPKRRPADARRADRVARLARARRLRHVRAGIGLRSPDAALPGRAQHRPRRRGPRGGQAAVRRSAVRRHRRSDARLRGQARRRHEGAPVTPPPAAEAAALPLPSALRHTRARGRVRGVLAMLGPAFVACVAYIDPGNFATNIAGGAKYGYMLLWVIVAANLMAMLVQYLSAKTGIATGKNLPELCRAHFSRPVSWGLWVQAEAIAIATDRAEFVGAAIALNLLFGVPPFAAGLITAAVAFAILGLQTRGYRRFELAIAGFLGIVCLGFLYDLSFTGVDADAFAAGLIPGFEGTDSILLAVGILGATVMPHVVYLHSALTSTRIPAVDLSERRELLRFQRVDVVVAMGIAGV